MDSGAPTVAHSMVSLADTYIDAEKGHPITAVEDPLANYEIPMLPKGVKKALSQPVSRWNCFRVWYNPYRQVGAIHLGANLF